MKQDDSVLISVWEELNGEFLENDLFSEDEDIEVDKKVSEK